jgi:hypothetical protein
MAAPAMLIRFDPSVWEFVIREVVPKVALVCFTLAGPGAIFFSVYFTFRRGTRQLGLLMLVSGVVGFFCLAAAAALRIRVYPRYPLYGTSPDWLVTSVLCGLAGFTAGALIARMFYFRSPTGLTKRWSEPPPAAHSHLR